MNRKNRLNLLLLITVSAGLTACSTQELQSEIDVLNVEINALDTELSSARSENSALDRRVEELETYLTNLDLPPDLSRNVSTLERDVDDLESAVLDLGWDIDDFRTCVNAYMDTIGDWSSNVYSYYNYYYC